MKNIIIKLNKTDTFEQVSLTSAYAGAKCETDAASFERIATQEADARFLGQMWKEMCGLITERLRSFISASSLTDEEFSVTLELSSSYDDSLTPSVVTDIQACMVAGIIARWFQFSLPEKADEWTTNLDTIINRVIGKLCHRKRPIRKS